MPNDIQPVEGHEFHLEAGLFGKSPCKVTPAVSKHLRVLADAGLVHERKVGRETRYKLNADPLS